ncbi:hypothetical protein FJ250_05880, partial [bacterium]|nr:hypothetical protein [bacterium]
MPQFRLITAAVLTAWCLAGAPSRAAPDPPVSVGGMALARDDDGALRAVVPAKAGAGRRAVPASLATLLAAEVPGFDKSSLTTAPLGTWACLGPPGAEIEAALAPLVEWRRRQGYHVVTAATDQIGGNTVHSVKAWLQSLYDTLATPLEMVCLVGDANGPVAVETWRESLSGYSGEGDHFYTQLDGDDVLGDVQT